MKKRILPNGRVVETFCGCDEPWSYTDCYCLGHSFEDQCPKCGLFEWTHFDTNNIKEES